MQKEYDEGSNLWSPKDNPSEIASNRINALFPSKTRFLSMIMVAKNGQNLMTVNSFKEMANVQSVFFGFKKGDLNIASLCLGYCAATSGPLNFFNTYSTLDGITTDAALKTKIHAGKGGSGQVISLNEIMKETNVKIVQDMKTGAVNTDFTSFKATQITIILKDTYTKEQNKELELALEKEVLAQNNKSKLIKTYFFSISSQGEAFSADIKSDLQLVSMAVLLVSIYCLLFMGSFSPIHSRISLSLGGLLVVGLSFSSASGLLSICGLAKSGVHNLLPFLLIGIGVDDMFVIVNSVDLTPTTLDSNVRFI